MKLLFADFKLPYLLRDSEYPVGGWTVQLSSWLKGLAAGRHRVGVLTWKGASAYIGPDSPCDVLDTYDPAGGIPVLRHFVNHAPALYAATRAYEPDVIIEACSGLRTGIMAYVAKSLDKPYVYRVAHDADTDHRLAKVVKQGYARVGYRYGLRNTSAILCQNRYQFDCLSQKKLRAQLAIIHNPFSSTGIRSSSSSESRRYIAWLAVFRQEKNLPLLARLAKKLPSINFRVAGIPEVKASRTVLDAIETLKCLPNVEMAGYVHRDQVLAFLSGARALLITSDSEGFSNTILESLSVGTPLALRRQVDPDSIVSDNRLGFSAADEDELALRLQEIWSMEPAAFAEMSRRCSEYVRIRHDPVVKVHELMQVLEPIVDKARASKAKGR